jgi:hypothetical protein
VIRGISGLVGQIEQDRTGIENARLSAAWTFGINDRRHLAVRIDLSEGGQVLLALARVDRHHLIGQASLFEEEGNFGRVRRRMEVKANHLESLSVLDSFRLGPGLPSTLRA